MIDRGGFGGAGVLPDVSELAAGWGGAALGALDAAGGLDRVEPEEERGGVRRAGGAEPGALGSSLT